MTVDPSDSSKPTPEHPSSATGVLRGAASPSTAAISVGARLRNLLIAVAAIALSAALFLGLQTQVSEGSLSAQARQSVPLDVALKSGKPTLMEFYADWCTTCQAMAGDMGDLKREYGDRVNFVMLNVDNTKWLPEILSYQVDGIPHFVFLGQDGTAVASAIGEQPRSIVAANLDALIAGNPLPYAKATSGQTSAFKPPVTPKGTSDPRAHGSV